jgi:hypothetical protein
MEVPIAMTDTEKLRVFRAAARNARKLNRTLQTKSEKLETWLDRAVNRKARIDYDKAMVASPLYQDIVGALSALERGMVDVIQAAQL